MNKMAIVRLCEYMQSEEWSKLSADHKNEWIDIFYKRQKLEIQSAYVDGKCFSDRYTDSIDYMQKIFEI